MMIFKNYIILLSFALYLVVVSACQSQVLFDENHLNKGNWVIEQQPGGTVIFNDQTMEIDDAKGCTVWFKHKLMSPVKIEYDVMVINENGLHDRVSDLNCFWMAVDPEHPDDFFAGSKERMGKFSKYNSLNLYYVGYGGHNNSKTRFRRYDGNSERPLLPEHDLSDQKFMIVPNVKIHITLITKDNEISYSRNEEVIFSIDDRGFYSEGYFGIRTVKNHIKITNLKISKIP